MPTHESPRTVDHVPQVVRIDLNDQVYEYIKDRLLSRQFAPGAKLSSQALGDELGVSRSPVNHALTRLATEGLVIATRRAFLVRPMTAKLMSESHDTRLALELFAAEQTVGRLGEQELAHLRQLLDATLAVVKDGELTDKPSYLVANQRFHDYIVDSAGNEVLSETYRSLNVHRFMERVLLAIRFTRAGDSSAEHVRIVEAFEAGDVAAVRDALRANAETGKRLALEAIELGGGVL